MRKGVLFAHRRWHAKHATLLGEKMSAKPKETAEYRKRRDILFDQMLRRSSLEELVAAAADILDSPIILTTNTYRVLVLEDHGYEIDDPIWAAAREWGYCDAESIARFEAEGVTRQVHQTQDAFLLDQGLAESIPRILRKIQIYGRTGAYIGVFQMKGPFRQVDFETVNVLTDILSIMLERSPQELNPEKEMRESILSDLIDGTITSPTILNNRVRGAFWDTLPVFQCVLITPVSRTEGVDNADYISLTLRNSIPGAQVLTVPEGLLLLLNEKTEGDTRRHEEFLLQIADQYDLYLNTSREFRALIQLRDHYEGCHLVRDIARKYRFSNKLTRFDDVVFEALAEKLQAGGRRMFAQSGYLTLASYDRENGTDYCATLSTYAECGCNAAAAASKLYIHRNTMAKRLQRISEISGIDMTSGRELMHFYMTRKFFT